MSLEEYNRRRSILSKISVFFSILLVLPLLFLLISDSYSIETLLESAATPGIITLLKIGGGLSLFFLIIYAFLCKKYRVKPFWEY